MILHSTNPFALRDLAFSHGWIALPPWSWRADPPALLRTERLPSGVVIPIEITSDDVRIPSHTFQVRVPAELPAAERQALEYRLRWMMRLDEDLTEFHSLIRTLPGCEAVAARGEGRLLRSWDVYEDALKTICTTNTTWTQTKSMVVRLVERYGGRPGEIYPAEGHPSGIIAAFPDPERLAEVPDEELREAGLGYRAAAVRRLAAAFAAGELPREAWQWTRLSGDELHARLLALRGIGPYAAANLRMLLGHYDRLAIDSWLRRAVRDAWFGGASASDREIEAAFESFGLWQALVYWFHPALHPGRDAWRQQEERNLAVDSEA